MQYLDEDLKVAGKYKGNDYSQYSPWSCDTIGSYIGTKDAKPKDIVAVGLVEMVVSMLKKTSEILLVIGKLRDDQVIQRFPMDILQTFVVDMATAEKKFKDQ